MSSANMHIHALDGFPSGELLESHGRGESDVFPTRCEWVFTFLGRMLSTVTGGYHPPLWLKLLHCCPGLIRKANSCFLCRGVGSSMLSHVLEEICLFICLFQTFLHSLHHIHSIALFFTWGVSPLG